MLSGTPLARLPKLRRLAAGLKFIPIVESSAERSHAVVSKSLKRGTLHTEPYVSLALRSGEIRDLLQDPVHLVALAWHVELVRSRVWCLRRLGHERHSALKEWLQDSNELMGATGRHGQELSQALACAVIYHGDLSTHFMTHQPLFDHLGMRSPSTARDLFLAKRGAHRTSQDQLPSDRSWSGKVSGPVVDLPAGP